MLNTKTKTNRKVKSRLFQSGKKLITIFTVCLYSATMLSQSGTIISYTVVPSSPTTADYVKVYANLQFSSGSCNVSSQGHSTTGNASSGYALHCLGMLTFICSATDTFNLGYLPAGSNSFFLTLSTGSAPAPCSPGIVPDDTSTFYFNVSSPTGINELGITNEELGIYPNPTTGEFRIINSKFQIESIAVYDILGTLVVKAPLSFFQGEGTGVRSLSKGIYFMEIKTDKGTVNRKIILE